METTKKTCFKCKRSLILSEFYKHKAMADGHLGKCKDCTKQDAWESRHVKHRERVLEYDRRRAKMKERKDAAAIILARWKAQNPEKRASQNKLNTAVRDGKIKKQPCFVCGAKAEAHHPDYSRPLDVVWLCSAHHRQTHALAKKLTKDAA